MRIASTPYLALALALVGLGCSVDAEDGAAADAAFAVRLVVHWSPGQCVGASTVQAVVENRAGIRATRMAACQAGELEIGLRERGTYWVKATLSSETGRGEGRVVQATLAVDELATWWEASFEASLWKAAPAMR